MPVIAEDLAHGWRRCPEDLVVVEVIAPHSEILGALLTEDEDHRARTPRWWAVDGIRRLVVQISSVRVPDEPR